MSCAKEDKHMPLHVIKASGAKEPFNEAKLINSLARAGADEPTIETIVAALDDLPETITAKEIYKTAFSILRAQQETANAARYNVKKGLYQLGPAGFPFEKFAAHIFRNKNYTVELDQYVPGLCVMHEVDIVATNEHERLLIECKFHNLQGPDSNIKTVLYIKARFDDVVKKWEINNNGYKKFDAVMLVSNTNFTMDAITYAKCAGIRLLGWSYPRNDNLADLIEQYKLYPITCLTTLNLYQKVWLIREGFVLCKDLIDAPESVLEQFGLTPDTTTKVIREARNLCRIGVARS